MNQKCLFGAISSKTEIPSVPTMERETAVATIGKPDTLNHHKCISGSPSNESQMLGRDTFFQTRVPAGPDQGK
jgi:hypothetical protein